MACEMFVLARALTMSRLRIEKRDTSDDELRARIFELTYGDDLDAATTARVMTRLTRRM